MTVHHIELSPSSLFLTSLAVVVFNQIDPSYQATKSNQTGRTHTHTHTYEHRRGATANLSKQQNAM